MKLTSNRMLRRWVKDMALGAFLFLMLPVLALSSPSAHHRWALNEAFAGEVLATRAVEVTSPAGPVAENALVAAAQLQPDGVTLQARRLPELAVLGLTFSLLVAFNMAFWRHLRLSKAFTRQKAGERKR